MILFFVTGFVFSHGNKRVFLCITQGDKVVELSYKTHHIEIDIVQFRLCRLRNQSFQRHGSIYSIFKNSHLILLRLLGPVLGTTRQPVTDTAQIQCSSDKMVLDSGTILGSTTADEDDTVLLDVVAFTRNISRNHTSTTQSHSGSLSLSRIRLLRLRNTRLETHALQLRPVVQRRRSSLTRGLRHTTSLSDLIVCSLCARSAGE